MNVLRGDMSIVGPRPDLPHHVEMYTDQQRRRLEVRPGITGGPRSQDANDLSWEERINLDIEYVERWSPSPRSGHPRQDGRGRHRRGGRRAPATGR